MSFAAVAAPAAQIELISVARAGGGALSGPSSIGDLSADGRYVVFASRAADVVPGQVDWPNAWSTPGEPASWDVFVRDRSLQTTTLVTHAASSVKTAGDRTDSLSPVISGDGRYVALMSGRTDLLPGPIGPTGDWQVYLYDRLLNVSTLVSHRHDSQGTAAFGDSTRPQISYDGRFVAYLSDAIDVVPGSYDSRPGVFVFDRLTKSSRTVTRYANVGGRLSMDLAGRFIVFDQGGTSNDVYLYDRENESVKLVSHAADAPAMAGNGYSYVVAISGDGSTVLFSSTATDLVPGQIDTNNDGDVFAWDRAADKTYLVSRSTVAAVQAANRTSHSASISTNGHWIAFVSEATDLVAGAADTNETYDVYLYDRVPGEVRLVSHASESPTTTANRGSSGPFLSPDGSRIAFYSGASNLFAGQTDSAPWWNFVLQERSSGVTSLVGPFSKPGLPYVYGLVTGVRFSADGRSLAFGGFGALTPADGNADWDAYFYGDPPAVPGPFSPCTLLDTRQSEGGGALSSDARRVLVVGGACRVPAAARWVDVKVTALQASGKGNLRFFPGNETTTTAKSLRFNKGQTRSTNQTLRLATNGDGTVAIVPFVAARGSVHVVVEVLSYSN